MCGDDTNAVRPLIRCAGVLNSAITAYLPGEKVGMSVSVYSPIGMNRRLLPSLMAALVTVVASCTSEPGAPPSADSLSSSTTDGRIAVGTLALVRQDGIFLLRGKDLTQLTDDSNDSDPTWSPHGSRIAFVRTEQGEDVYVMNADGTNQRLVAEDAFAPQWLPDGRIAFMRRDTVFAIRPDGTQEAPVVTVGRSGDFSLSPSGSTIAIVSQRNWDWDSDVYLVNANTGDLGLLTVNHADDLDPQWSPDGESIVFRSTREWERDTDDDRYAASPPGGDGTWELYVMDADGSNPRQLTDHPGLKQFMAWSPDSSAILFTSSRGGSGVILFVVRPDGTGLRRVARDVYQAAWRPGT
jgi:Tol biopolymer transport system component